MSEPKDIIGIVKELLRRCSEMDEQQTVEDVTDEIMGQFPDVAQALLIAVKPLLAHEHLVRGECLAACAHCQALAQIRSLTKA